MYALAWILPLEYNISQKKTAWIRGYVEDKGGQWDMYIYLYLCNDEI